MKGFDRLMKNAIASVLMLRVAKVIGGYLARHMPEAEARDYIDHPKKILGIKLPDDLTAILGSGFIGLTVLEILNRLIPIPDDWNDYIQDAAVMIGEAYNDARKAGTPNTATASPSGGRSATMKPTNIWYYSPKLKAVCLHDCPRGERFKPDGSPDPDWKQIELSRIIQAKIPASVPAAGEFCLCQAVLQEDIADATGAVAGAKPAVPPPADGKFRPPSLVELLGEIMRSGNAALIAKAKAFVKLVAGAKLERSERFLLEHCDTMNELIALLECDNADQLKALLPQLQAAAERGILGEAGEQIQLLGDRGMSFLRKQSEEGKKRAPEQRRRLAVVRLCDELQVTRSEVFWALKASRPDLQHPEQLIEKDVMDAVTIIPGTDQSLVTLYREQKQQIETQRQAAKPPRSFGDKLFRGLLGFGR